MALRFYDKKTKKFYTRIPKLVHIGPITRPASEKHLTDDDKIRISEDVDKIVYFGTEFGAKAIISTSDHDIFKIRDEVQNSRTLTNKINIQKMKTNYKEVDGLDIIKRQLGL